MPIYNKLVKDLYIKMPDKKRTDPSIIQVITQLVDIMLGNSVLPKYLNPGSPLVNVTINGTVIKNTLIDLGVAINVMTKQIMD